MDGGDIDQLGSQQKDISLSQAIRSKYLDSLEVEEKPGISFPTFGGAQRDLEYARSEKLNRQLKCLEKRTEMELKSCSIAMVDIDTELMEKFRNVTLLDLSNNKLTSWKQVADIIGSLPSLVHIIVTGNPLQPVEDTQDCQDLVDSFKQIKLLTMGRLNYAWNQIESCSIKMWPNIECLDVFANSIREITPLKSLTFTSLKALTLTDNQIVHWKYINQLGHLENLERLQLVNCSLESVYIDAPKSFPALKHLDLKNNKLNSWKDVANLNKLPSLEELIVRGNPLFDDLHRDYAFNFVIGIVGRLKYLNRTQITPNIRKEGEIHYLRFNYPMYLKAIQNGDKTFMEENPRYLELIEYYGEPLDRAVKSKKDQPNKLVNLNLIKLDGSTVNKRIPRKITISALKILVKRLLSIDDMEDITLWVKSQNEINQEIEYPLDREDHDLDYYAIKDNDCLSVKFGH